MQGDTGHAQGKMVTEVYSHIIDEDRRNNAILFEKMFYADPADEHIAASSSVSEASESKSPTDAQALVAMLTQSPELVKQLAASLLEQLVHSN